MSDIFIGRQPVLDTEMNVFAYDLQFYQGLSPSEKMLQATRDLINKIQESIGFQSIIGEHSAVLHLPSSLICKEVLPNLNKNFPLLLEISKEVIGNVQVLRNLKALKQDGSRIVLGDLSASESSAKLASISDYVKMDIEAHPEIDLRSTVDALHDKGIKVIAQNVDTQEKFQVLKKLGFDYFQGYFFNQPTIINGQKLSGNRLILLELLAKINAPYTRFQELSYIISQDVALSYKLLEVINRPAAMVPVQVDSISDALRYLGLNRLKFWVNTMVLSDLEGVPKELLTSSLARAKFCERLALDTGYQKESESFFLVGLFSNLGAFFKMPIEDIVIDMPLSNEIKAALIQRFGPMGETLNVLETLEKLDASSNQLHFKELNVTDLSERFLLANAWAQQAIL